MQFRDKEEMTSTLLDAACRAGRKDVVEIILEYKSEELWHAQSSSGDTALHYVASTLGEQVELLLQKEKNCRLLWKSTANSLNILNESGCTVLDLAILKFFNPKWNKGLSLRQMVGTLASLLRAGVVRGPKKSTAITPSWLSKVPDMIVKALCLIIGDHLSDGLLEDKSEFGGYMRDGEGTMRLCQLVLGNLLHKAKEDAPELLVNDILFGRGSADAITALLAVENIGGGRARVWDGLKEEFFGKLFDAPDLTLKQRTTEVLERTQPEILTLLLDFVLPESPQTPTNLWERFMFCETLGGDMEYGLFPWYNIYS
jgi:hypothetical protein